MSRDWSPKELNMAQKHFKMGNLVDGLVFVGTDGVETPFYTPEEIALSHKYTQLGMFGFDLLLMCKENGTLSSEKGKQLIEQIDNYFKGIEIEDTDLKEKTELWYNGQLVPGYYLEHNNMEFADYLKSRSKD